MEDKQAQEQAETTAPVMPTEEQPAEVTDSTNPDGEKERTAEQFEKLKEHNKQLKERLDQLESAKPKQSVLESLRPADNFPNVSQAQAAELQEEVVDEQGYVDPTLLNQKLAEANRIAQQAIQTANQAQQQLRNFEETQITKELYKQYPQLNPNGDSFDPKFYRKVRNELVGQLTDGKNQDVFEAAKTVSEDSTTQVKVQVQEQEDFSLKQQASSTLGTSQGASAPVDHDWLVEETRKGNPEALAERLARGGY